MLIVNFYIQCVSCAQMLILTLKCHINVKHNIYTDHEIWVQIFTYL